MSCREDGICPIKDGRLVEHMVSTWDLRLRDDSAGLPPCAYDVDRGTVYDDEPGSESVPKAKPAKEAM